ncbi:MAG: hypothetical protein H0X05_05835 [Actinobacteria bacterium]|nr:hypothetical protein [Actinomycetota bacterium]MDQ3210110.1 hypothetical protein [Actinomycetota bacterium]
MWIEATPEVCSFVKEHGGMLFVWPRRFLGFPGGLTMLETTTEPPPDALEWRRIEMRNFLLFVPRKMRLPEQLHLQLRGRFRRRIDALWNGCIYVV